MAIEGPIVQDEEYRHIKTGGRYMILVGSHSVEGQPLETLAKTGDHPDDTATEHPGWVPVIIYYDGNRSHMTFARDETSFREKFERV